MSKDVPVFNKPLVSFGSPGEFLKSPIFPHAPVISGFQWMGRGMSPPTPQTPDLPDPEVKPVTEMPDLGDPVKNKKRQADILRKMSSGAAGTIMSGGGLGG